MDNPPPQDDHAERALLACILTGADILDDVAAIVQPRDMYQPKHEAVYAACLEVHNRGDRVDPVTLPIPPAGRPYLIDLASPDAPVAVPQAIAYARMVADAAVRRRLVDAGTRVVQLGRSDMDATQAALDSLQVVAEAAEQANTTDEAVAIGDAIEEAIDWLETPPVGAATPWADVNDATNGLLAGQMITVAARPGHGKSLALKDVAVFTAKQGRPVHIATLEMSRNEYMARILSTEARVNLGNMLKRLMSDNEWERVARAAAKVRELPLYLDDRPSQSMAQVRAGARRTARRYGGVLGLIGIDYAQLVRAADTRLPREQQVAQISRDTKLMAKELGCPTMLLAQLNRGNTQRSDHTPVPSDLRESGALEQDSDQVWLLHRPDQYGDGMERMGEVDLIVGKNRNGPQTRVALAFRGHESHIASMA